MWKIGCVDQILILSCGKILSIFSAFSTMYFFVTNQFILYIVCNNPEGTLKVVMTGLKQRGAFNRIVFHLGCSKCYYCVSHKICLYQILFLLWILCIKFYDHLFFNWFIFIGSLLFSMTLILLHIYYRKYICNQTSPVRSFFVYSGWARLVIYL